ncbi:MAG: nucleotidyltransferase domain-containing protein [Desulfurococcales archaeon]|nr:nucleotidyltransferase domain-containing protein [Desulfurococcales archaeon]
MQKKSSGSVEIKLFKLDYKRILDELKSYARRVIGRGARAVILIGSLARGDYTAFSDADIIIIVNNAPSNPLDRIKEFIDPSLSIDLQPRVYTFQEFIEMARQRSRIVRETIEHGILLGGDKEVVKAITRMFRKKETV